MMMMIYVLRGFCNILTPAKVSDPGQCVKIGNAVAVGEKMLE